MGPISALGAGPVALLVLATWHLLRTRYPLITLRTLRDPTFRLSQSSGFLFWLVVGAAPFLLPLLFQSVFGWSAVRSGAVVLFIFVGNVAIKPATTPLLNLFGFRRVLLTAAVGLLATMVGLGFTTVATPLPVIIALTLRLGGLLPGADTVARNYTAAFLLLGLVALATVIGASRLHPNAGNSIRARRTSPASGVVTTSGADRPI
jgi:Na+/melibiose symporter-like transporter